jgi:hypothetical protein
METTLNRLQLPSLRNSEYTLFINQLAAIITKHNPIHLHLEKSSNRLMAMLPKLAKIKAQELGNELSNSLHEHDNERDTLLNAITGQVKAMSNVTLTTIAPQVAIMNHFFDIHGRDIARANYNAETERINKLMDDYDTKADVTSAAEALNLKILFDQLRLVNSQFAELFMQRTGEESATEKVNAMAIRAETDKVLTAFFAAFEFCSTEYDELDYQTPANELNTLIDYYKTQLKARATRRSEGKDVSKEEPIG